MKQALVGMVLVMMLGANLFSQAQQSASTNTGTVVPTLVRFSGTLTDVNGKPLTGSAGVTFALYSDQQGGAPLWIETQSVALDRSGRYSVQLGSTASQGLPTGLFTSGEARWLGVQPEGQAEQPRVLLLSVPYALKAADAETIGGLPPSAFVLAAPASSSGAGVTGGDATTSTPASAAPLASSNVTTTGGTVNTIPLFTTATNIQNSLLTQTSTTAINVGGKLNLPSTAAATKTAGTDSRPLDFVASSFSSTTSTAVNQTFQWQAEPVANDTTSPSGTLNLLYGLGATAPSETGLKLSSKGLFTFATGQTFPGTGPGTITGITTATGSGLSGGGTTGTLSLKVPAAGITNAMLADSKITLNANTAGGLTTPGAMTLGSTYTMGLKPCTAKQILQYSGTAWNCAAASGTITGVTAGTDLTGGGTTGKVTLNLDTTKVPLLAAANTFTAEQLISSGGGSPSLSVSNSGGAAGVYSIAAGAGIFGETTTNTALGGVMGVDGSAAGTGNGVYGTSSFGNGVYGHSTSGNGVYGQTAGAGSSGVYGSNSAGGLGVAGTVPAGGTGVYGENQSTSVGGDGILGRAHTSSGNGVHGTNDVSLAVGVYGENSATNGYGVYGHAPNGYGMATDSNASQARSMGGWVKAMVYVNFGAAIGRCFNSQLPGSQATTVPCGITLTIPASGEYLLDFGFQVDDRFLQLTDGPYSSVTVNACLDDLCPALSSTQVAVYYTGSTPPPFFLSIF